MKTSCKGDQDIGMTLQFENFKLTSSYDIRTIEINADVLLNACKDIGLAVNIGKTKYMKIGRHRGMIAIAHIKIGSNSYEKVETFKYLSSLLTKQNSIKEEIKCRLKA